MIIATTAAEILVDTIQDWGVEVVFVLPGDAIIADKVNGELDVKAMHRDVIEAEGSYALCESAEAYAGNFVGKMTV